MTINWGSVLTNIGSSLLSGSRSRNEARESKEITQMRIDADKELVGLTAREARETQKQQALLEEWMRQNKRSERARGSKNFTQFAGDMGSYQRQAAPVERQVTPDEFIAGGGIVSQLQAQQPNAPAQGPVPNNPYGIGGNGNWRVIP